MRRVTLDTETYLIRPGLLVPKLVCIQVGEVQGDAPPASYRDLFNRVRADLHLPASGLPVVHALLDDPEVQIVGQNIAYDWAVLANTDMSLLPKIFAAYEADRIEDIKIREKLILLALGRLADEGESGAKLQEKFDLGAIVKRHFDIDISEDKHSTTSWRLRYSELDGVPLDQWPPEAKRYALDDVRWNLTVDVAQAAQAGGPIPDSFSQARAAFWMHLMGAWGVRTDPIAVDLVEKKLRKQIEGMDKILRDAGILQAKIVKGIEDWSMSKEALRAVVTRGYGTKPVPHTKGRKNKDTGEYDNPEMSVKREVMLAVVNEAALEALDDLREKHATDADVSIAKQFNVTSLQLRDWEILRAAAQRSGVEKSLGTFVPTLREGTMRPITPNWNSLVATGRISCIKPNLTFQPRKGGIRECYVPRPGWMYGISDYSFIELVTLSQTCKDWFGWSKLADAINAGMDPHLDMAATILGITYEEAKARKKEPEIKNARQSAKAVNFGYPGGLGWEKMIVYARTNYGVHLDEKTSRALKEKWYTKWPEMRLYHKKISALTAGTGECKIVQPVSGRHRGGCSYCPACNSPFQGRTADGAKRAGFLIARECYLARPYPTVEEHLARGLKVDDQGEPLPSPLYGSRICLFVHDEFVIESPIDRAPKATRRLSEVMVMGMREYVADVTVKAEAVLCERWYKGAEPVYGPDGELVPWRPEAKAA